MGYRFFTADVFTDKPFGGNQLAVLPDARGLSDELMLTITREFNYSETTFVFPPDDPAHTRRLRIFTPGGELPFAGHPTVGTAFVLAAIGELGQGTETTKIVFEEGVGPVPVTIWWENGRPVFSQLTAAKLPEFGPPSPSAAELAAVLSIEPEEVMENGRFTPQAASAGTPFLFIPVRSRQALARCHINHDQWAAVLGNYWTKKVYPFTFEVEREGSFLRSRMFAPSLGIREDPATGAAAAALAGYLGVRDETADGTVRWVVEQGFEMGRPSILHVEADKQGGAITAVRVGGASVLISQGELLTPLNR